MTVVQLIVDLGNPGPKYDQTRHNVRALFVECLAHAQGASLVADHKCLGLVSKFSHQGKDVRPLIPTTYMNRSNQSVAALAGFFRITPGAILAAHNELDMPPGVAKLKTGGGHGGHNGLRDIIAQLDSQNSFHRLRLGIGHLGHSGLVSGYVLGRVPRNGQGPLDTSIDLALGVLPEMPAGGWTRAMQRLYGQKAWTTLLAPV